MRVASGGDDEWARRLRDRARRDAEALIPRPGYPIFGLAAPVLTPGTVSQSQLSNGEWTAITLHYGPWTETAGPHVTVTTAVVDPSMIAGPGMHGRDHENELRYAIEEEHRGAHRRGARQEPYSGVPGALSRERLPFGEAAVIREGEVWAARVLIGQSPAVVVTVVGREVDPEAVRLEPVSDLRPLIEAREAEIGRIIEENRRKPPPAPPDLPPAEGVAALRALADVTLESHAEIKTAADSHRPPRLDPARNRMWGALWQRAVQERQRVAGTSKQAADEVITLAINHLGHLLEEAPWFTSDARLREAAIDETLRHAMLGVPVPSDPAQLAWERYWTSRLAGRGDPPAPGSFMVALEAEQARIADWLAAWASWTESA